MTLSGRHYTTTRLRLNASDKKMVMSKNGAISTPKSAGSRAQIFTSCHRSGHGIVEEGDEVGADSSRKISISTVDSRTRPNHRATRRRREAAERRPRCERRGPEREVVGGRTTEEGANLPRVIAPSPGAPTGGGLKTTAPPNSSWMMRPPAPKGAGDQRTRSQTGL